MKKENKTKQAYLYVMSRSDDDMQYKIGLSIRPDSRARQLMMLPDIQISVEHKVKTLLPFKAEARAHALATSLGFERLDFMDTGNPSEWFNMELEDAKFIIEISAIKEITLNGIRKDTPAVRGLRKQRRVSYK